jgi:hypothetical protein
VFMISLFTHIQFCGHQIIVCQQWTKVSNITRTMYRPSRYSDKKAYITHRVLPRYTILKRDKEKEYMQY